jgi:outer membrane protein OmpA-like peptidoglycan-associated protein
MKHVILVGVAASLLAACATVPQRSDQLDQARAETDTLAQEPLAQQAAGRDLAAARQSLQQAEVAQQQHQPPAIVDHLAYIAMRHAQAGEARVSEARARQEVARAQEDRNKILLDSRTREAQTAQAQAQNAQAQAQNAQAQAQDAQAQAEAAKNAALAAQSQLASAQQQLADLQAKKTDRGMVVTLGDVLFDTGQSTLKPGADLVIGRLATFLNANPQTKIMIEGHTDSRGSDEYNDVRAACPGGGKRAERAGCCAGQFADHGSWQGLSGRIQRYPRGPPAESPRRNHLQRPVRSICAGGELVDSLPSLSRPQAPLNGA